MLTYTGEIAALLTAFFWMLSSLCWTAAGERVGSLSVNVLRLLMALPMLVLYAWVVQGEALPFSASLHSWLWLGLSGAFGFFVCDMFLFRSFLLIGPRLGMLILSLSPPLTALIGWVALGERLSGTNWIGMGLALAGVAWVVLESPSTRGGSGRRYVFSVRGGLMALVGSAAQACAIVTAKIGLQDRISAIGATEIRLVSGLGCFLILILVLRRYPMVFGACRNRQALGIISLGTVCGPVVGVTLMMVAVQRIPSGLAQTFLSTSPVMIIPFMRVLYHERVGWRATAGAVVACIGVSLLFVK